MEKRAASGLNGNIDPEKHVLASDRLSNRCKARYVTLGRTRGLTKYQLSWETLLTGWWENESIKKYFEFWKHEGILF